MHGDDEETLLLSRNGLVHRSSRCCRIAAVSAAIFGLLCIVVGVVGPFLINRAIHDKILDSVTITPDSLNSWANARRDNAPAKNHYYYVFNITNIGDVLGNSSSPQFEEIGPFVYREYTMMYNNTFLDNDRQWQYSTYSTYEFQSELSLAGSSPDDVVVVTPWNTAAALLGQFFGVADGVTMGVAGTAAASLVEMVVGIVCKLAPESAATCFSDVYNHFGSFTGIPSVNLSANASVTSSPLIMAALKTASPHVYIIVQMLGPIEYAYFAQQAANGSDLSLTGGEFQQLLMTGGADFPCPLSKENNVTGFPCCLLPLDPKAFPILSSAQLAAVTRYLQATGAGVELAYGLAGAVNASISPLYVRRSVSQLLFNYSDPLLHLLGAPSASNYVTSLPDAEAAYAVDPTTTTVLTGIDNPSLIDWYVVWRGMSTLPGSVWCADPVPVRGLDDSQFPPADDSFWSMSPRVTSKASFWVWVEDLFQPVRFSYYDQYSYRNTIPLIRLTIAPEFYQPNPALGQKYGGSLNMNCPLGAPILITLPRFLRAERTPAYTWPNLPPISEAEGLTFLDVDPISGATMIGYKRLQINILYLGTEVLPVFYDNEESLLIEQDFHDYKDNVLHNLHVAHVIELAGIIGGAAITFSVLVATAYTTYLSDRYHREHRQLTTNI
jgi:hypothetical protein